MKYKLFWSFLFVLHSISLSAQNAYYDAMWLAKQVSPGTGQFDPDDDEKFNYLIYEKYKLDKSDTNVFLQSFFVNGNVSSADDKKIRNPGDIIGAVGGLNVTTLADGVAQFLIERANEELNIWFFNKFKEDLKANKELQILFPATTEYLMLTEPYQYAQFIHLFREAFKKDLTSLINNMEDLAQLEKYQKLIEKYPHAKVAVAGLAGASIVSQLVNNQHPATVIDSLGRKTYLRGVHDNLYSGLRLLSVFSQSVRHAEAGKAYVSFSDFQTNILRDTTTFRIFVGLLYQQLDSTAITVKGHKHNLRTVLRRNAKDILRSQMFGLQILKHLNEIETRFGEIKKASQTPQGVTYLQYHEFFNHVISFLDTGLDVGEYFSDTSNIRPDKTHQIRKYLFVARKGNEIYKNINEKNYSLAVLNFTIIYDTLFRSVESAIEKFRALESKRDKTYAILKTSKPALAAAIDISNSDHVILAGKSVHWKTALKENTDLRSVRKALRAYNDSTSINTGISLQFMRYASFMASVAESKTPADVKAAISAVALPPGSSIIKKVSPFSVSLNAYLGGFWGNEYLEGGEGWSSIYGVAAPIGVALNTRFRPVGKHPGSLSLFLSLVDIGAVANFRVKDDETELLPEIKLENIFAPGIHVVYGIPRTPLSLGYGWQRGPQLRQVNIPDPQNPGGFINEFANGYRWSIFFAVDIPLINLYRTHD